MKKLLLTLLIALSTTILAKTPESLSLFGVYIDDNALDYFTKEELKSKYRDSSRGFYQLRLKNPPVSNKKYSDMLFVMFDKNNKIGRIQSDKKFQNFETCEKVEYSVRRALESKYSIEFLKNPHATYGFDKWVEGNVLSTQCNIFGNDDIVLSIALNTKEYFDKYNAYLDSRI